MAKPSKKVPEVEFHPDAWERFERAIDVAAKAPPQHRVTKKAKKTAKKPKNAKKRKSDSLQNRHKT
jgi:hypothetical protein